MPFTIKTAVVAALATMATAMPSGPKLNESQMKLYDLAKRQNEGAQQSGLTDIDILQL